MTATARLALVPPPPTLVDLDAAVLVAEQALQAAKLRRDTFCRQWSADNGYCVVLKPEQVRRAIGGKV